MEITFLALVSADLIRHRFAINPSRIAAIIMALFGLFGGFLWNTCSTFPGAGLPSRIYSIPYIGSPAESAFMCAAVGFVVASLFSQRNVAKDTTNGRFIRPRLVATLPLVSLALLALWLVGEGSNILSRDVYLGANGAVWVQRLTSYICPFLAAAILYAVKRYGASSSKLNTAVGVIWVILLAATGTRVVELFIVSIFLSFPRSKGGAQWVTFLRNATQVAVGFFCFIVAFRLSLFSRNHPLGLFRLPENLFGTQGAVFIGIEEVRTTLGTLGASIFAGYAIVEQSIRHAPPLTLILANANPLPSLQQDPSSFQAERLWPYVWVPQGFWGQIFGAGGPTLTIGLCVLVGFVANLFYLRARSRDRNIEASLILILAILMTFVGTEYPSRNFFRLVSLTVFLPIGLMVMRRVAARIKKPTQITEGDAVTFQLGH